ncbi:MAG: phage head closure protein [Rickettsiales bacterium]
MKKLNDRVSSLRHRIEIESPVLTPIGGGQYDLGWSNFATVWAAIEPAQSRIVNVEKLRDEQLETPVSHRIRLRFMEGITTKMRIVFGGRVFNIRSVINPDERNEFLLLLAEEQVAI